MDFVLFSYFNDCYSYSVLFVDVFVSAPLSVLWYPSVFVMERMEPKLELLPSVLDVFTTVVALSSLLSS